MRNTLIMALVLTGFLVGTVTLATAGTVTWKILESSNAAGRGPGPNDEIGVPACPGGTAHTDDTTTGEWNSCNLSNAFACMTGATPSNGSYSYTATEYVQTNSCFDGVDVGKACTTNADCTGSTCYPCNDDPSGWDLVLYIGNIGNASGNGTMTWCQDTGSSGATITSIKTGMSSPDPLAGPVCSVLDPAGAPYSTTACGVDVPLSWTVDTLTKAYACTVTMGQLSGITTQGRVIDVNDSTPTPTCGYTAADILCLQAEAPPTAKYLLISCSSVNFPDPIPQMCLAGGSSEGRLVYWTADDASDCTSECPPPPSGCMAGTAEGVE